MKKIGFLIRNFYRITFVKPNGSKLQKSIVMDNNHADEFLRKIIKCDPEAFDPDPEICKLLASRVYGKRRPLAENSIFSMLLPLISLRNIELKMAIISLIFIISLGIKPSANFQFRRDINPSFLADTLIDSSKLDNCYDLIKLR